jgi:uncharacterized membrane protein
MPIHVRLLASLAALILGVLIAGAGITEFFGKDSSFVVAMVGAALGAAGFFMILPLLQNMPATKQGLAQWAAQSPVAAKATGGVCAFVGAMILLIVIWIFLGAEMRRGSGRVLGGGIVLGGGLIFLGYTIFRMSPKPPEDQL